VAFVDEVEQGAIWVIAGDVDGPGGYGVRRTLIGLGGTEAEPLQGAIQMARQNEGP
jgi:hypothetical protein